MAIARSLFVEDKKLRVFYFDDSLIDSTSLIFVTNTNTGLKFKLNIVQYVLYTPKVGDVFDYSNFGKINNPTILKGYFELLKKMVHTSFDRKVYILTNRNSYKTIHNFIRDTHINGVCVIVLNNDKPETKAGWIELQITENSYDNVFFMDTSTKNTDSVRKTLNKYSNITKIIQLAPHL
jgi:hypothetical protein